MAQDWVHILKPLLDGGWEVTPNDKIKPITEIMAKDMPWSYSNVLFDCTVWNKVFHVVVSNKKLVHSHCHDCIKIVAKPKTLRDLVKIELIQKDMLFPCKCGIDRRSNTQDIYGAFWYNRGFDEARMRFPLIRARMDKAGLKKVPLIIKRGCTEFENAIGPSDKWKPPTAEQIQLEEDLDSVLDYTSRPPTEIPTLIENHTHHLWTYWAFQHGDDTYLDFTNGVRIHEPLVTYDPEGED